ncbi:MAG TPA: helix-turn-helix domain-containing protein, partial [Ktedonobacterales bacterium]|nr:helix-turn-helix domain-containing protein [Ktedonobacterales bacterium]
MPDTRIPTFGELVKHYRVTSGLSIDDLARRTRLTAEAISIIESRSDLLPRAETVDRLADVFDLGGRERKLFKAVGLGKPVTDDLLPARIQSDVNIPSSIYVFLIADVRGYTAFTQANGDMIAAQLAAKFAEVAREVVSAWEGRVIELRGDEVLAMFGSARKALQAAVVLQERFQIATQDNPHL